MAKFVFRLESLKKFREHRLLVARKEMIFVEQKLLNKKSERARMQESLQSLLDENVLCQNVDMMRLSADLIAGITEQSRQCDREIIDVENELERHQRWVTQLGRDLKILEKLEEKKLLEWKHAEQLKEKRQIDAWTVERWPREQAKQKATEVESA